MNFRKIIEQAVKAWYVNYGEGNYDLANHNCEHFANMIIHGIDISKQITIRDINLSNEISNTNNSLGKRDNSQSREIKSNTERSIPPKVNECAIM